MWIEIYYAPDTTYELINSTTVNSIRVDVGTSYTEVEIYFNHHESRTTIPDKAFYHALLMALQGQDVDLGDLGHVRPLKSGQREELHKRMMYTLNDCIFKG